MIRATPGEGSVIAVLSGAPTLLVGTIGFRILDNNGATVLARTTSGIVEDSTNSGTYTATFTAPVTAGQYTVMWDTGGALSPSNTATDDLIVDPVQVQCFAVSPGQTFHASVTGPTGATSMGYQIRDPAGGVVQTRTTTGVHEYPTGSGVYYGPVTAPLTVGRYVIEWSTTGTYSPSTVAGDEIIVVAAPVSPTLTGSGKIDHSLFLCGDEICNPMRSLTYLNKYGPGTISVDMAGMPSIFTRMRGAATETFTSPAADPAPWYDATHPESGDFLGVLIENVDLEAVTSRAVIQKGQGGAALGRPVDTGRTAKITGWLVASAECGIEYGKLWFTDALRQACDPLSPCDATIRLCAPPDDGSDDDLGKWNLVRTGIVSGPTYTDIGSCAELVQFEVTLVAEKPELVKDPVVCLPATVLWPTNTPGGACVDFCDWYAGVGGPVNACVFTPPKAGKISARITITADSDNLADIQVGVWGAIPDPSITPTNALLIPYLPAGAQLIIDSARHRLIYIDPTGIVSDGAPYVNFMKDEDGNYLGWSWIEIDDCSPTSSVGVQVAHQCGGGAFGSVMIEAILEAA